MSITRTYHCDGCGKALEHDAPILHVEVAASYLDDHGADGPLRLRRKRRRMRIRDERCALLDFCGDCRTQPLAIGALLDKRSPPPVTFARLELGSPQRLEIDGPHVRELWAPLGELKLPIEVLP